MTDVVSIKVNGVSISGWEGVEVTADIESVPRLATVRASALASGVPAKAGDPVEVYLGADKVLSGWVDVDDNGGDESGHDLNLTARGYCADLVDCSAEWPGGQIVGANALAVCQKLAAPYSKISVSAVAGADLGPVIPQFTLNNGETAYTLIERVTAYAGLLAYEDANGALLLSQVGATQAASGLVYGQNVVRWRVTNSMAQRYSAYACAMLSIDTGGDLGAFGPFFTEPDPSVTRHRLMYLIADAIPDPQAFCERRAKWEAARRFGRGTVATATVTGWRDQAGTLWTPNTLVPVTLPGLRTPGGTASLLLSRVTYRDDGEGGELADLTLMPPQAFQILQLPIVPASPDLTPKASP